MFTNFQNHLAGTFGLGFELGSAASDISVTISVSVVECRWTFLIVVKIFLTLLELIRKLVVGIIIFMHMKASSNNEK